MASNLPSAVYRAAQLRALDALLCHHLGIDSLVLMERAGAAAFAQLQQRWPLARRLLVCCGPGNNGGDGYVLARLAHQADYDVQVLALVPPHELHGDAGQAAAAYVDHGGSWLLYSGQGADFVPRRAHVIVDAILGTGLNKEVTGTTRALIENINTGNLPCLALDIPSGLSADTGRVYGVAIQATVTVTFIGLKLGLLTGEGPDHSGTIVYESLGAQDDTLQQIPCAARRVLDGEIGTALPRRARSTHKGANGHVLVIGGAEGFSGAARMAAEAALRVGAGLVTVATSPMHAHFLNMGRPELMCTGVATAEDLTPLLKRATVLALGPGLGQASWGQELYDMALRMPYPLVVDADGLNLLARTPTRRDDWVLTPHPGEASRLLGTTPQAIQQDRPAAAQALQQRYGGVILLKGAGTLVCDGNNLALSDTGNPGMATGGMGDVLTGVVAGLLAQGLDPFDAARLGAWVHGRAADVAAGRHERGLLPSDLYSPLQALVNP
jgi:NAD(P)H-hydrate epimerase